MVKACLPRTLLLLSVWVFFVFTAAAGTEEGAAAAAAAPDGDARARLARWLLEGRGSLGLVAEEPPRRRGEESGGGGVGGVGGGSEEGKAGLMDLMCRWAQQQPPTATTDRNKPVPLEDRVVLTIPTPAALFGRQNNPEEAINSISRSAQQALAQASQSAREAVQQAQDQVRQAQDQAKQANDAATRASISANNAVVQAQASAKEGILDAQNAAKDSASKQIAANLAMVTSSASSLLAAQVASIQSSAAVAVAAATASANAAVQQAQQSAQQQIQAAKDEANLRVSQAQGTAISVTQTALAVVGAIIGSSLLTVLGIYAFTRHRRSKRKEALRREISYPKGSSAYGSERGYAGSDDYPPDFKRPLSPTRPGTARTAGSRGSGGMGYAVSDYSIDVPTNYSRSTTFIGSPPPKKNLAKNAGAGLVKREPSVARKPVGAVPSAAVTTTAAAAPVPAPAPAAISSSPMKQQQGQQGQQHQQHQSFSLFPVPSKEGSPIRSLPSNPAPYRDPPPAFSSNDKLRNADSNNNNNKNSINNIINNKKAIGNSGKSWLKVTDSSDPYGDLDSPTDPSANWPFAKSNRQSRY